MNSGAETKGATPVIKKFAVIYTSEIVNPESITEKQIDKLIKIGVPEALGKTAEDYRKEAPKILSQSTLVLPREQDHERKYFDKPLIVETRLSLEKLVELAGFVSRIRINQIQDEDRVSNKPFATWTHFGEYYRQFSTQEALKWKMEFEVSSPLIVVMNAFIQYGELLKGQKIDAVGSRYRNSMVPSIDYHQKWVEIDANSLTNRDIRSGIMTHLNFYEEKKLAA